MFAVDVLLKPAGNAPILKKKKWTVDRHKQIGWICEFIRKFIRTETEDSVVSTLYIITHKYTHTCLLYTSDAADEALSVDLGGRRIIK